MLKYLGMFAEQGFLRSRGLGTCEAGDLAASPPPEVVAMLNETSLTPSQLRLLEHMAFNFQMPVSEENLYENMFGELSDVSGERRGKLWHLICRTRDVLPANYALYNIRNFSQYVLDWRRDIGSWFLPPDRARRISSMPKEIINLMNFCAEVEVYSSSTLQSRFTPTELAVIERIAASYPEPVAREDLADVIWNGHSGYDCCVPALYTTTSRIRGKLVEFSQGAQLSNIQNGQYGLLLS